MSEGERRRKVSPGGRRVQAKGESRSEASAGESRVQAGSERRRKNAEALVDDTRRLVYKLLEYKLHF